MSDRPPGPRQEQRIAADDPEFSVRVATFPDLQRLTREARSRHLASWSSAEALARQVPADSMAFLCPLVRNGATADEPESYRCHVWFVEQREHAIGGAVSLVDVTRDSFESLREASDPAQLKKIIRFLLDSHPLSALA